MANIPVHDTTIFTPQLLMEKFNARSIKIDLKKSQQYSRFYQENRMVLIIVIFLHSVAAHCNRFYLLRLHSHVKSQHTK